MINTYTEAVQTVDPKQAVGKLHHLWVNFAKFYDENGQLDDARVILEKATHVAFLKVTMKLDVDLGIVWTNRLLTFLACLHEEFQKMMLISRKGPDTVRSLSAGRRAPKSFTYNFFSTVIFCGLSGRSNGS